MASLETALETVAGIAVIAENVRLVQSKSLSQPSWLGRNVHTLWVLK
jgi:hypothetical protein